MLLGEKELSTLFFSFCRKVQIALSGTTVTLYCARRIRTVLPRITAQGSYCFEVVKKGELFEGWKELLFVLFAKNLRFLFKLAFHMTMQTDFTSGNNVITAIESV